MGYDETGEAILRRLVRTGTVSSVDYSRWTARMTLEDQTDADGNPLVTADLPVLQAPPLITLEGAENDADWDFSGAYATAPVDCDGNRRPDLDNLLPYVSYTKAYPDTCEISRTDQYRQNSVDGDTIVHETWSHRLIVRPWMPYIGQKVVCVFLPLRNSPGFVIGGLHK